MSIAEGAFPIDRWKAARILHCMNSLSATEYYPRMALGTPPLTVAVARTGGQQQLRLMQDAIMEIFRVVEPCEENQSTYGHQIRSLLILAATEFEAQCKGILEANHASPAGQNLNTNDYVKLRDPLKLSDHALKLHAYPEYPLVEPFKEWDASRPTKSLPWYDAYNQTKHDRESRFNVATLGATIDALAACEIILWSQWSGCPYMAESPGTHGGRPFALGPDGFPEWADAERYPGRTDQFVTAVDYPF